MTPTYQMNTFDRTLHWVLSKVFKFRDIAKNNSLYLRRFYLTPRVKWLKYRLFLHNIRRPDDDRHMHDHPWGFRTVVLKGGYIEEYVHSQYRHVTVLRTLRVGDTVYNPATHTHRIRTCLNLPTDSTWTLVIAERASRTWGFWTKKGWVNWRTYLNLPDAEDFPEDV